MLELFINKKDDTKQIILTKDGKMIEFYEEEENTNRNEGNIFIGVVKNILNGMESAFVDIGTEKNGYIHLKDLLPQVDEKKKKVDDKNQIKNIRSVVKENDTILVQVKKDSNNQKGARISTHISLPSKYIVLMPNTDIVTVSQKIENKEEQERLINLVKETLDNNNGAVIRTSAEGKTQEIIEDIKNVQQIWNNINNKYKETKTKKPMMIYKNQDIVQKILIDLSNKQLSKVISNSKEDLESIKEIVSTQKEYKNLKLELNQQEDLSDIYDINIQIDKLNKRKIWLKCGGFITIDKTEALTAIDVNTGKFTEGKSLADIILKVNEQATVEIAKQIRLRDIGGIIIIDYIDMLRNGDKEKIEKLLKECLKEDRAKTQVEGFTKLDLMELTRKHICSHNQNIEEF